MEPGDELVDVVDDHDVVVRTVTRREMRSQALRHRCVYLLVVSSRRDLLVHQRSFAKDVCPGWWDIAAGGVVGHDEPYADAARRELAEELGIDAEPVEIGSGTFDSELYAIVGRVYLVRHDGPFHFADGEVIAAEWLPLEEVLPDGPRLTSRQWCPDSIELALPHLAGHLPPHLR